MAAAAVAVPMALLPRPVSTGQGPASPAAAATIAWNSAFVCGGPMPSRLPGAAGDGLRITISSVTRTASGAPAVRWSIDGSGNAIGPVSAGLLVVRGGAIFAAGPVGSPAETHVAATPRLTVTSGQVFRYEPLLIDGTSGDWAAVWQRHQDYRVIIVATIWTGRGNPAVPVPLSVSAPLPAS